MRNLAIVAGSAALVGVLGAEAALAQPSRIILLRHGEKKNSAELCDVGALRAQALSDQYLGKGASGNEIIFGKGGKPDAFFTVTLHTQETAEPSAKKIALHNRQPRFSKELSGRAAELVTQPVKNRRWPG